MKSTQLMSIAVLVVLLSATAVFYRLPECYPVVQDIMYEKPTSEDIATIGEDYSETGSFGHVLVTGNSMQPRYQGNQHCLCRKTDDYKIGDVVAFFVEYDELEIVMHRIHSIDDGVITTKGDNNFAVDSAQIQEEDIICELEDVPLYEWIINYFKEII